jgi:membrane protein required for colicin V production
MNFFDIIVMVIVVLSLVRGGFRGFVKEIASIAGVVAGFYGASVYYPMVGDLLLPWIDVETYRDLLGFFIMFMVIVVGVGLGATLLRYFLKVALLGWMDRLCGMIFGAAKGLLVCVVIFIIATTFVPGQGTWISTSRLSPYLSEISQWASLFVDNDIKTQFQIKIKRMKALWEKQKMGAKTRE